MSELLTCQFERFL